jgi:hypothetical protein
MAGNGESGEGVNETWRTGVVFIIVWMVVREYVAFLALVVSRTEIRSEEEFWQLGTLMFVAIYRVVNISRVFKITTDHCG